MNTVETIQLKGNVRVEIYQYDSPESPREWDNLGTMVCFHRRMNLGDTDHGFRSSDDLKEYLDSLHGKYIGLYIRAYEHSGITITSDPIKAVSYPYNDQWDSGWLGMIFVTYEKIIKEYGWKYITSKRAKRIRGYLQNEVKTYDQYLTGDVYGYVTYCNQCESELDSCWGFYGSNWEENGLLEYAQGSECKDCKDLLTRLDSITPEIEMMKGS